MSIRCPIHWMRWLSLNSTIYLKSWVRCVKRWHLLRDRFWTYYCISFSEMSLYTFHSLFMFDKMNKLLWGVLIFYMPPSEPLRASWLIRNEWVVMKSPLHGMCLCNVCCLQLLWFILLMFFLELVNPSNCCIQSRSPFNVTFVRRKSTSLWLSHCNGCVMSIHLVFFLWVLEFFFLILIGMFSVLLH